MHRYMVKCTIFYYEKFRKWGVTVHKVNIGFDTCGVTEKLIFKLLYHAIAALQKVNKKNPTYTIKRTIMWQHMIERKFKKAEKTYPNADANFIISLSVSGKNILKKPIFMFGDWTIEYLIREHQHRKPGFWEQRAIHRQNQEIMKGDYIITLFPNVQKYMEKSYHKKIYYLGNVINSEIVEYNKEKVIHDKFKQERYLFIGRKQYLSGAECLCKAVKQYNSKSNRKIKVDIIGLNKDDNRLFQNDDNIRCFGYLSKNDSIQKNIYYDCVVSAKVIVNVTKDWNGISSIIEAMYYCTPIVLCPNPDTLEMFGETCLFGKYINSDSPEELCEAIKYIQQMSFDEYKDWCIKAYEAVKDYTWDSYTKRIIEILKS